MVQFGNHLEVSIHESTTSITFIDPSHMLLRHAGCWHMMHPAATTIIVPFYDDMPPLPAISLSRALLRRGLCLHHIKMCQAELVPATSGP